MKWIGQHIVSLIARFRSDVYLEDISTGTIASGAHLGLDSSNKIVKAADGGGDLTSIVAGTGLSGTSLTGPIPTLNVDASQTQITSVGTIGAGVWQGDVINATYLDGQSGTNTGDETLASVNALDITEVGTISSGVWNGDVIASAYIDGDAINGDKIANAAVDSEHYADGSIDTAHIADDQVTFAKASGVTPNVYGSTIKLIPSDFLANDDGGNTKFGIGYVETAGAGYGMRVANNATELYAFVSIPEGMKATAVVVYDKNDLAVAVFEAQINATTMAALETGNCNTGFTITDTNSTATNFLVIQVTTTSATNDKIYGGSVTIAAQ